jgi:hypothetical protein
VQGIKPHVETLPFIVYGSAASKAHGDRNSTSEDMNNQPATDAHSLAGIGSDL